MPSSSSSTAGIIRCRGCGRVPSHIEIATVWPGFTSSRSGGPATGWRSASRSSAGLVLGGRDVRRLHDRRTVGGEVDVQPGLAVRQPDGHRASLMRACLPRTADDAQMTPSLLAS